MKPLSTFPQAVVSVMVAFEKMVRQCKRRRDELKAELGFLQVKARVMGVKDDTHWLVTQFIVPREAEYASLSAQVLELEAKMEDVRRASVVVMPSPSPAPTPTLKACGVGQGSAPSMVWLETGASGVLALTA